METLKFSDIANEIWIPIKDYKKLYEVSNLGRIKSHKRLGTKGGILVPILSKSYYSVNLWKNGHLKIKKIHRLVCQAFLPNIENKPQINHIDGNKLNNKLSNLEWVTQAENMRHAYNIGLAKAPMKNRFGCNNPTSKKVRQYDKTGNFLKEYNSIKDAAAINGLWATAISRCTKNKLKTTGGYIWKN